MTLPKMPAAGALDQRVIIQRRTTGEDALGQRVESWSDVCTVWASAQPLRGRELIAADAVQSKVSVRFRIRHRSGVTGTLRVQWRGVNHAIVGEPIDVDGGRHTLELMCEAGTQ